MTGTPKRRILCQSFFRFKIFLIKDFNNHDEEIRNIK